MFRSRENKMIDCRLVEEFKTTVAKQITNSYIDTMVYHDGVRVNNLQSVVGRGIVKLSSIV